MTRRHRLQAVADKAAGAQFSSQQAEGNFVKKRSRESDALSANLPRRQHRTPDVAVSRKEVRNLHPASHIDARHQVRARKAAQSPRSSMAHARDSLGRMPMCDILCAKGSHAHRAIHKDSVPD
jgi:hypothetical protein